MIEPTLSEPAQTVEAALQEPSAPSKRWTSVQVLAVIVFIAACWAARELIVPILLGLFLALVANPVVKRLCKLHMPRWIAAFFVVFGGVALLITLGTQLVAPASEWVQKAPQELRQIAPKLRGLVKKVDEANKAAASIVSAAGAGAGLAGNPQGATPAVSDKPAPPNVWSLLRAAPGMLAVFAAIILLSYFFVVYGVGLQKQVISVLPHRHQKRLTAEILQTIETELSRYVLTISTINFVLGTILFLALWSLGLDARDALLWGAVGAVLNYAPYVGPVIGLISLALVGVVAFDQPTRMLLPPAIYLGLQLLESEVVTPIILGRSWSISPLIVLLWLLFCGWLWGIAGVLLAVPIMVCFKIVAERIEGLHGWVKVIQ